MCSSLKSGAFGKLTMTRTLVVKLSRFLLAQARPITSCSQGLIILCQWRWKIVFCLQTYSRVNSNKVQVMAKEKFQAQYLAVVFEQLNKNCNILRFDIDVKVIISHDCNPFESELHFDVELSVSVGRLFGVPVSEVPPEPQVIIAAPSATLSLFCSFVSLYVPAVCVVLFFVMVWSYDGVQLKFHTS